MSILVILARGIQASRLGAYGGAWTVTPHLDNLASQSLVFDGYIRSSSIAETWGNWLASGARPWYWVGEEGGMPALIDGCKILPALQEEPVTIVRRMNELLEVLESNQNAMVIIELRHAVPPWEPSGDTLKIFFPPASQIQNPDSEKSAAISNISCDLDLIGEFVDPHPWIEPLPCSGDINNDSDIERMFLTHAAAIASMDHQLGLILDCVGKKQSNCIDILFTSDAGVALGAKKIFGHGSNTPWLEMVHLPLIWCHATRVVNSLRHPALITDNDLAALLCKYSDGPESMMDRCWMDPDALGAKIIITYGDQHNFAARSKKWSLVCNNSNTPMLFSLPSDYWEVNNMASRESGSVEQLIIELQFLTETQRYGTLN